jgi:hypothetical protein
MNFWYSASNESTCFFVAGVDGEEIPPVGRGFKNGLCVIVLCGILFGFILLVYFAIFISPVNYMSHFNLFSFRT